MTADIHALRINEKRLVARIEALGKIGALEGGGVCRLALTDTEKLGRDYLVAEMKSLGLSVEIDAIGNIFGTRAGVQSGSVVMIGSHIDTVATGGMYDGALGVLAGLEVIATLNETGIKTNYPITVAAFTNEEGARFSPDMLGSLVYVGGLSADEALDTIGIDGSRLGTELERIAYDGRDSGPKEIRAYFELHIEQGPILEDEGIEIGAVAGVQGISWTELTIRGRSAHAGATPMRLRHDAGLAAARITVGVRELINQVGPEQVTTVGATTLSPNLVNVVAEKAILTIDMRNPDEAKLQEAEALLSALIKQVAEEEGVNIERRILARFEPVAFDNSLIDQVEQQALALGLSCRGMYSGAGHDAQMIARSAPAAMIFVPSHKGISHNITEYTKPTDLSNGANVLLNVIVSNAKLVPM